MTLRIGLLSTARINAKLAAGARASSRARVVAVASRKLQPPEQLGRIENPDRKSRFQFVMPAVSADPVERDRWFRSLTDVTNRRHESWVLEGLTYLHHPTGEPTTSPPDAGRGHESAGGERR